MGRNLATGKIQSPRRLGLICILLFLLHTETVGHLEHSKWPTVSVCNKNKKFPVLHYNSISKPNPSIHPTSF
jgi:hypothetical protein